MLHFSCSNNLESTWINAHRNEMNVSPGNIVNFIKYILHRNERKFFKLQEYTNMTIERVTSYS